jgi:hypothetical protein
LVFLLPGSPSILEASEVLFCFFGSMLSQFPEPFCCDSLCSLSSCFQLSLILHFRLSSFWPFSLIARGCGPSSASYVLVIG